MHRLISLSLASLLVIATATPSAARMASIQTTAPLQDHEEQSVKSAVKEAVKSAVTGAMAMGLPWVQIRRAVVLEDAVAVQILATDTDPEAATEQQAPDLDKESPDGPGSNIDQSPQADF
jgi:hypothetical protein